MEFSTLFADSTLLYKFERIFPLFFYASMDFHSSVLIFGLNFALFLLIFEQNFPLRTLASNQF